MKSKVSLESILTNNKTNIWGPKFQNFIEILTQKLKTLVNDQIKIQIVGCIHGLVICGWSNCNGFLRVYFETVVFREWVMDSHYDSLSWCPRKLEATEQKMLGLSLEVFLTDTIFSDESPKLPV